MGHKEKNDIVEMRRHIEGVCLISSFFGILFGLFVGMIWMDLSIGFRVAFFLIGLGVIYFSGRMGKTLILEKTLPLMEKETEQAMRMARKHLLNELQSRAKIQ